MVSRDFQKLYLTRAGQIAGTQLEEVLFEEGDLRTIEDQSQSQASLSSSISRSDQRLATVGAVYLCCGVQRGYCVVK